MNPCEPSGEKSDYILDGRNGKKVDIAGTDKNTLNQTEEGRAHELPNAEVDPGEQRYGYDKERNLTQFIDANGHVRESRYGAFDLLQSQTDAEGNRWTFDYDRDHLQLTRVTNPRGEHYDLSYDAAGRLTGERDYNGRRLRYEYNAAGQLTRRTNGLDQTIDFHYDRAGRLVRKLSGSSEYRYNALGQLLEATTGQSRIEYEYNARGQLIREIQNGQPIEYAYDNLGRRTARHLHPSPGSRARRPCRPNTATMPMAN